MLGVFAKSERAQDHGARGRPPQAAHGRDEHNSHGIDGYRHVGKAPTSPAALVINEERAAFVRSIFEMFASGNFVVTISRCLKTVAF
jgi:hypothetical protein